MTVRVFHEGEPLVPGATVQLDGDESHYLARVRRIGPGHAIEIFDGRGGHFGGRVVTLVSGRRAHVEIGAAIPSPVVPRVELLLGYPDVRAALDAITMAAELGCARIVLVTCERSPGRPPTAQRIAAVLRATSRQCGRPRPPAVDGPTMLDAALSAAPARGFFAWEGRRGRFDAVTPPQGDTAVLVGPEGGLTAAEVEQAQAAGLSPLGLGPWTLRTPTAVCAALSRIWPSP